MLVNAMRGLAAEFGLTVAKGRDKLEDLVALMKADKAIPSRARQAFTELFVQCGALAESIATFEAEIVAHARHGVEGGVRAHEEEGASCWMDHRDEAHHAAGRAP